MKCAASRALKPFLLLILFAGCAEPIGVRSTDDQAWFRKVNVTALSSDSPSVYAAEFLAERGLIELQQETPLAVLDSIRAELCTDRSREAACVLAELSYLQAKRPWQAPEETLGLYADVVICAYAFLFDDELGEAPSAFDGRFRLACDLYNRSLAKLILEARERRIHWGDALQFPSSFGHLDIRYGRNESHWGTGAYHDVRTVYEFETVGLRNHYRTSGLGVPVIMLRRPPSEEERTPQDRFLPRQADQAYPATVLLSLQGSLCGQGGGQPTLAGTLDVFDPVETAEANIGTCEVRLETDLTTPIAYALEHSPPVSGVTGLLDVPAWEDRRGLYMLHPYRPGKIPVVFVHGLLSSPLTWLEMINDLNGDPEIREHFQLWYFMYPTGNPILYSAGMLRQSLLDAQMTFDPEGDDAAFNRMVLVGHSMGGLLSRLNIQRSSDSLWRFVTDRPFDEMDFPPAEREMLRDVFFFEPLPFVSRAIFIATPHRGSDLADLSITQSFSSMITLPDMVNNALADLQRNIPEARSSFERRDVTSLAGLSTESPLLRTMENMPISPRVTYHSIIADKKAAGRRGGSDTVVPYRSAALAGAASELIVKGTHSCTDEPAVIREVRRILMEHIAASKVAGGLQSVRSLDSHAVSEGAKHRR